MIGVAGVVGRTVQGVKVERSVSNVTYGTQRIAFVWPQGKVCWVGEWVDALLWIMEYWCSLVSGSRNSLPSRQKQKSCWFLYQPEFTFIACLRIGVSIYMVCKVLIYKNYGYIFGLSFGIGL